MQLSNEEKRNWPGMARVEEEVKKTRQKLRVYLDANNFTGPLLPGGPGELRGGCGAPQGVLRNIPFVQCLWQAFTRPCALFNLTVILCFRCHSCQPTAALCVSVADFHSLHGKMFMMHCKLKHESSFQNHKNCMSNKFSQLWKKFCGRKTEENVYDGRLQKGRIRLFSLVLGLAKKLLHRYYRKTQMNFLASPTLCILWYYINLFT